MIGRRLLWLAFGIVLLILCGMAGGTVYHGLTTGCIKARYGYHCQATVPGRYAITMVLTGLGCLVLTTGTVLGFGMAFTRSLARRHARSAPSPPPVPAPLRR